ncbi:MAG: hypothetical protein A3I44_01155 [Candidatus Sungbacteria bacterium RIFCSPLOWO2_02_FULL_51_17]|uniref:Uncharacterized protein n=1 Tax=Candidatus Sungbacteria bacterium RIFCSPHIGHO2_02_FULL_51_29 TaxID=1802273 RepID=A0A1G2KS60_9BACT|nr:MAG: hypothetical protein A2676_00860 [Candidatus Sungbacteria bacterium RIFCSPHIGHO2_01_FULL_51_22]OHA02183.1 MAG: hypothetical protein A3C16_00655 [Candidatus Sungbacteria bacterium RIFCSPHIGHO2_02_FULL_51_29]OHA07293.1 MAG: hypothetical protein A3B29_04280 [Candidatus Sungbacteria bacterium RIFCSPLOWO2_01_FULL_51_34]OHA10729.1 MAG: hypothetical protein A3I44_01155 [Candidatus Sungbacteria bacterium RIFCSPLOWO2_02_FULL_51_17]
MKTVFTFLIVGLLFFIIGGLLFFLFFDFASLAKDGGAHIGLGWYALSYAAGLTMIVLPCTLPLAFVVVPLSMGKGPVKGLSIALAFGVGVVATLSMYGVVTAYLGNAAISGLGASIETVKNYMYLFAGLFAYVFALGELGLVKFRMPTYSGAYPMFIQRQKDVIKALMLGLFLGNIGIGCPHPATPFILTRIATSGDIYEGWLLFFVHAIGRILPLLLLAILGIIGVNALSFVVTHKEKIERATGWGMVFVAGFILTLGLFSHDWWVNSGQHTLFEEIVQEQRFTTSIAENLGVENVHRHGPIAVPQTLFDLPWQLGNWFLVFVWVLPFWWYYRRKKAGLSALPDDEQRVWRAKLTTLFWNYILLTALLLLLVVYVLPTRFYQQSLSESMMHDDAETVAHAHEDEPDDHGMEMGGDQVHATSAYHEEVDVTEGAAVNFSVALAPAQAENNEALLFYVNDKTLGVPIATSSLQLNHEKRMHVLGVRSDMNEFFHIHPESTSTPGLFGISHVFANPGIYKLWSEIMLGGTVHTFGHAPIDVEGDGVRDEKEVSFGRTVTAGAYDVSLLAGAPLMLGKSEPIAFDIHGSEGEVMLENYIGAAMHLTIIKDDWKQFIHAHPDASRGHGVAFSVQFPEAGRYKAFAQFRPRGAELGEEEALLAAFWLEVKDAQPGGISSRVLLPIFSVVSILLLGLLVRRYLDVPKDFKPKKPS